MDEDVQPTPRSKVGRLLRAYDLEGLGDELVRRWTAEEGERSSLRDLAAYFNRELLRAALEDAGAAPLEGEAKNLYRLLSDEDVSGGIKVEVRNRLKREGVDVGALEEDFVSYQAIRTYLKDVREAEYESGSDADMVERMTRSMGRLRSRTASVAESNLRQLRNADEISISDPETFVEVTVFCDECGAQYTYDELLDRGGCNCRGAVEG